MAHSKQARKRIITNLKSEARNRPVRTFTSRRVRDAHTAVTAGGPEAVEAVRQAQSALDKAVKSGVIHANSAARRKSRLQKALKAANAAA
ncbi:MAG: 30S ribosomal protein S20 [Chloroflexota bacterium]